MFTDDNFLHSSITDPNIGINNWNEETTIEYLNENIKGFQEDDAKILKANRIDGEALLMLTKEDLINHPYNLPGGIANNFIQLPSACRVVIFIIFIIFCVIDIEYVIYC